MLDKIAIVGGGVAGASVARHLGMLGLEVTLFEEKETLVDGPPFCHLHAGGNLYREISDAQCLALLKQSIAFARLYPYVIEYRPTVIALPLEDAMAPEALLPRLQWLQKAYEALVLEEEENAVLGDPKSYYRLYSKAEMEALSKQEVCSVASTQDEWMVALAQKLDLSKVQYPLILVEEYGLNLFRLASGVTLELEALSCVTLQRETKVEKIVSSQGRWELSFSHKGKMKREKFDYVINAAGYQSGTVDAMVGVSTPRMVEFKAAYVTHCDALEKSTFPEVIFHGERGTPQGMGQFTPYAHGYVQLHGMTEEITLYADGLARNSPTNVQPQLPSHCIEKVEKGWQKEELTVRTKKAIAHLARFLPFFSQAKVCDKPLFGIQQIPGSDPTLRVAEVAFPLDKYARCEIVKVSSVSDMIEAIVKEWHFDGLRMVKQYPSLDEKKVEALAEKLCLERHYPSHLAQRVNPRA